MLDLKEHIRAVPDFPMAGITFRDIQPLLAYPPALSPVITQIVEAWEGRVDAVVGLDARGFLFATPVAIKLGLPVMMVRKKGKLPGETISVEYDLEYGHATVEMGLGLLQPGAKVLVVDDLLATGGTALAACQLIEQQGAKVAGCAFVIELADLLGRQRLAQYPVEALVKYE